MSCQKYSLTRNLAQGVRNATSMLDFSKHAVNAWLNPCTIFSLYSRMDNVAMCFSFIIQLIFSFARIFIAIFLFLWARQEFEGLETTYGGWKKELRCITTEGGTKKGTHFLIKFFWDKKWHSEMIESGPNRIKITSADFLQKGTKKSWKPEKCIWHGHKGLKWFLKEHWQLIN